MKHLPLLPLILLGLLVLSGCSGAPSWAQGDWRFDQDRTTKEMNQPASPGDNSGGGFDLSKMMSGLSNMLNSQVVQQLTGMEVIINGTDVISTVGGAGHSHKYKVVEKSADQVVVKLDDDTVETYYRSGDEMYVYATGVSTFKVYFQRSQ